MPLGAGDIRAIRIGLVILLQEGHRLKVCAAGAWTDQSGLVNNNPLPPHPFFVTAESKGLSWSHFVTVDSKGFSVASRCKLLILLCLTISAAATDGREQNAFRQKAGPNADARVPKEYYTTTVNRDELRQARKDRKKLHRGHRVRSTEITETGSWR